MPPTLGRVDTWKASEMRKILMGLCLVAVSLAASAEWRRQGVSEGGIVHIDRDSLKQTALRNQMLTLTEYPKAQTLGARRYLSVIATYEFDCMTMQFRSKQATYYASHGGEGPTISSVTLDGPMKSPDRGSLGEGMTKLFCEYKAHG